MNDEKNQKKPDSQDEERIAWHPAFFEAIQMELEEYGQDLQFISEYPLNTEPLRIDVIIIKKHKDVVIEKNIGTIFKKVNILEYKSPEDNVAVEDLYKVCAYAYLYKVLNPVDIREITLTFVGSRYPRELIKHIEEVRDYLVEEKSPGIYTVKGDIVPIQIIDSRKLSAEENLWLKGLDNRLKAAEIRRVTGEIARQGNAARIGAYLDVVLKANKESLMEALKMSGTQLTLDKVFEEAGLVAKWELRGEARGEARGEERKASEIAKNMLKNGFSMEETSKLSGLDMAKVRILSDTL